MALNPEDANHIVVRGSLSGSRRRATSIALSRAAITMSTSSPYRRANVRIRLTPRTYCELGRAASYLSRRRTHHRVGALIKPDDDVLAGRGS